MTLRSTLRYTFASALTCFFIVSLSVIHSPNVYAESSSPSISTNQHDDIAHAKKKKKKKKKGKKGKGPKVSLKFSVNDKKLGKLFSGKKAKVKKGGNFVLKVGMKKGYRAGIFINDKFLAASKPTSSAAKSKGLKKFKYKIQNIQDDANIEVRFVEDSYSFTEVLNMVFFGLGNQEMTTVEATPTFSIQAESDQDVPITQIKWINRSNGTSGSATKGDSGWDAPIPLTQGDNDLIFTAIAADWSEEVREMIVVRHYEETFAYPVQLSDEVMFTTATEDDLKLRFHVGLIGTTNDLSVSLDRVNEKGFYIGPQSSLADDGVLPDEISKDGVFTLDKEIDVSEGEGYQYYRAKVSSKDDAYASSRIMRIWVTTPLTSDDVAATVAVSDKAKSLYDTAIAEGKSQLQAATEAAELLKSEANVKAAGANSTNGIWAIVTDRGLLAAYNPVVSGKRGAGLTSLASTSSEPSVQALSVSDDDNSIFSRRGVIVSPYINHPTASDDRDIESGDDLFGPWSVLPTDSKNCELAASDQVVNNGSANVTLASFKNVNEYGLIHFSSHGDNFFYNIIRSWEDDWGPKDLIRGAISKVVLDSGVYMAKSGSSYDYSDIEKDLLLKRIALGPSGALYLMPSFFEKYLETLPNSLVVLSSCRSMANRSLADAFLAKGAGAVLGFTDYVSHEFAQSFVSHVYTQMLAGADAQSAFNSAVTNVGASDGVATPQLVGDSPSTLVFPSGAGIFNGGFERGFTPWVREGDGRRLGRLGETGPVTGSFLGIISTGLGYSESSGSMYQEICVDDNAQELNFWWNFFSEEFLEFCGSQFQDTFTVYICTGQIGGEDENCTQLLHYKIDDLCDLHEKGTDLLTESDVHFDKGGVYYTGWKNSSISLQDYQGQLVTIKFSAGDVGDSIYDTAILLDDIKQQ